MPLTYFLSKISDLKRSDGKFQRFGAHRHQYRFGSVLSEPELVSAEQYFGITLPEDYRNFILTVGNGGAGPGYGLQRFGHPNQLPKQEKTTPQHVQTTYTGEGVTYPAAEHDKYFDQLYWEGLTKLAKNPKSVTRPFKFTSGVRLEDMDVPEGKNEYEKWERDVWDLRDDGTIMLCSYGCGITAKLVITGTSRGTVWVDDECDGEAIAPFCEFAGMFPELPENKPYSFSEWYYLWSLSDNTNFRLA